MSQTFTGPIKEKRLRNFQDVICKMHGGRKNIKYSPLLTPQKKQFIGLQDENEKDGISEEFEEINVNYVSKQKKIEVLEAIKLHAQQNPEYHAATIMKVDKYLRKVI